VLAYQTESQRRELRGRVDRQRNARMERFLFEGSHLVRLLMYWRRGNRNLLRMNFVLPSREALETERERGGGGRMAAEALLQEFESLATSHGFQFLIAPVPQVQNLSASLQSLRRDTLEMSSQVLDVNSELVSLMRKESLDREDLYWRRDNHLNATGNRVFARAVARALRRKHLGALRSGRR
jgi:hypothetical protein